MIALEWRHQPHRYGHRQGRYMVAAIIGGETVAMFYGMSYAIAWAETEAS